MNNMSDTLLSYFRYNKPLFKTKKKTTNKKTNKKQNDYMQQVLVFFFVFGFFRRAGDIFAYKKFIIIF